MVDEDWGRIVPVFASAFGLLAPYKSFVPEERQAAIARQMERTRAGDYGPLIETACVVAEEEDMRGALICAEWEKAPHLTWVGVRHDQRRKGYGTCMFHQAIAALAPQWPSLTSAVYADHTASLIWHWRNSRSLKCTACFEKCSTFAGHTKEC